MYLQALVILLIYCFTVAAVKGFLKNVHSFLMILYLNKKTLLPETWQITNAYHIKEQGLAQKKKLKIYSNCNLYPPP